MQILDRLKHAESKIINFQNEKNQLEVFVEGLSRISIDDDVKSFIRNESLIIYSRKKVEFHPLIPPNWFMQMCRLNMMQIYLKG